MKPTPRLALMLRREGAGAHALHSLLLLGGPASRQELAREREEARRRLRDRWREQALDGAGGGLRRSGGMAAGGDSEEREHELWRRSTAVAVLASGAM